MLRRQAVVGPLVEPNKLYISIPPEGAGSRDVIRDSIVNHCGWSLTFAVCFLSVEGLRLLDAKNKRGETPLEVTADPQMKEFLKTMALEYTNTSNTLIALHPSEDAYHAVLGRRGRRAVNHIPSKDCEQYVLLLSHLVQSYARIDPEHILWKDFNLCVDNLERHVTRIVADCHLSPLIKIRLSAMRLLSES